MRVPAGTALVAAQRILALATESLDMMRSVTGVMKIVWIVLKRMYFPLTILFFFFFFFTDYSIPDGSAVYGQLVFNARHK